LSKVFDGDSADADADHRRPANAGTHGTAAGSEVVRLGFETGDPTAHDPFQPEK